jgi:hypothetical protein
MSWRFLAELVEDCLQADCLAGGQSAPSKSTSIASESCCSVSETDTSTSFRSGTTCEPSTAGLGVVESTSLPPAFLASLSAEPATDLVRTIPEICGHTSQEYLAKYDRDTDSWRTCQRSLFTNTLAEYSQTFPTAGEMQNGTCFRRRELEPIICGGAYGLLPTPTSIAGHQAGRYYECGGSQARRGWEVAFRRGLVKRFDLRSSRDPNWEEALMGWPIGWTALEPLATDKFQAWLSAHGVS